MAAIFVTLGETSEGVGQCLFVHACVSHAFRMRKRDHTISKSHSDMASRIRQDERPSAVLSRMEDRLSNPEKRWIFTSSWG